MFNVNLLAIVCTFYFNLPEFWSNIYCVALDDERKVQLLCKLTSKKTEIVYKKNSFLFNSCFKCLTIVLCSLIMTKKFV